MAKPTGPKFDVNEDVVFMTRTLGQAVDVPYRAKVCGVQVNGMTGEITYDLQRENTSGQDLGVTEDKLSKPAA